MKTVRITLLLISFAALCVCCDSRGGADLDKIPDNYKKQEEKVKATSFDARLGTYNIRVSTGDKSDPDNNWDTRKPRLVQSITENNFDVFGLQEVTTVAQKDLESELGQIYGFVFFSPYAQNGVGDKAQGIAYKKSKFKISDFHYYWVCDTPDVMTVNDVGETNYKRGGCCAVLTDLETGLQLFFMNTHGCLNKEPNTKWAYVYEQMEKRYNTAGLPSFFVGDMNSKPGSSAVNTFLAYWKDSREAATYKTGPENTFNSFQHADGASRIDWIFYRGDKVRIKNYVCNNKLYSKLFASDHFPVYIELTISR